MPLDTKQVKEKANELLETLIKMGVTEKDDQIAVLGTAYVINIPRRESYQNAAMLDADNYAYASVRGVTAFLLMRLKHRVQ